MKPSVLLLLVFTPFCALAQTTLQLPLNPGRISPGTDIKRAGNGDYLMSTYFPGAVVFDGGDSNLTRFSLQDGVAWSKDFFFDFPNGGSYVSEWPQQSAILLTAFVLDTFYNKVLVKLDPQGNVLWSRRYGKARDVSAVGIFNGKTLATPLPDGNVLLAGGASAIFSSAGDNDLFVGKIDPNGAIVWAKNLCFSCLGDVDAAIGNIISTADGGFLLTGIVEQNNGQRNEDVLLVKLTANGEVQWAKSFNSGGLFFSNDDRGFEVKSLPNGNFVVAGAVENFIDNLSDGLLLEFTSNGDFVRSVTVRIANSDHTVTLPHLEVVDNNTLVFSGSTSQDTLSTVAQEFNLLAEVQLNGAINWSRKFYDEPLVGYGTGSNALLRLPEGGYGYLLNYALFFDFLYPILVLTDANGQTGCEEAVALSTQNNLVFTVANLPLTTEPLTFSENFPVSTTDFNGYKIDLPFPDLGTDTSTCAPLDLVLDVENPAIDTYSWSTGESSPSVTIAEAGEYAVTITAEAFCFTAADTVNIMESMDCDSLPDFCPLVIPNAFTPNNDGFNDLFTPIGDCPGLQEYTFRVFSRWGEMVFSSESPQDGWNGLINGQPATSDVYVWVLQYEDPVNGRVERGGDVSLLR